MAQKTDFFCASKSVCELRWCWYKLFYWNYLPLHNTASLQLTKKLDLTFERRQVSAGFESWGNLLWPAGFLHVTKLQSGLRNEHIHVVPAMRQPSDNVSHSVAASHVAFIASRKRGTTINILSVTNLDLTYSKWMSGAVASEPDTTLPYISAAPLHFSVWTVGPTQSLAKISGTVAPSLLLHKLRCR